MEGRSPGRLDAVAAMVAPVGPDAVVALEAMLRRYATARRWRPADVDDLVQETLTRLLEARMRLEPSTLAGYAVVTIDNLARSEWRRTEMERRHQPRLVDAAPSTPAEAALVTEEAAAVRAALDGLPDSMRAMLVEHYATTTPPPPQPSDRSSVAGRLARARARLRVEVLLAYRRVSLPTQRCRAVQTALSERDRRRQAEIRAGQHLLVCPVCAELAEPLIRRDRRLMVLVPLLPVIAAVRVIRQHAVVSAAIGAAVAGGIIAAIALPGHGAPSRPATLCQLSGPGAGRLVGQSISATVRVTACRPTRDSSSQPVAASVPGSSSPAAASPPSGYAPVTPCPWPVVSRRPPHLPRTRRVR